jgi:hypothetical protein
MLRNSTLHDNLLQTEDRPCNGKFCMYQSAYSSTMWFKIEM